MAFGDHRAHRDAGLIARADASADAGADALALLDSWIQLHRNRRAAGISAIWSFIASRPTPAALRRMPRFTRRLVGLGIARLGHRRFLHRLGLRRRASSPALAGCSSLLLRLHGAGGGGGAGLSRSSTIWASCGGNSGHLRAVVLRLGQQQEQQAQQRATIRMRLRMRRKRATSAGGRRQDRRAKRNETTARRAALRPLARSPGGGARSACASLASDAPRTTPR